MENINIFLKHLFYFIFTRNYIFHSLSSFFFLISVVKKKKQPSLIIEDIKLCPKNKRH